MMDFLRLVVALATGTLDEPGARRVQEPLQRAGYHRIAVMFDVDFAATTPRCEHYAWVIEVSGVGW